MRRFGGATLSLLDAGVGKNVYMDNAIRFPLTDEQSAAVACPAKLIRVLAFAGTGKTTMLVEFARARRAQRFLYLAYNASIQKEASKKFPPNVVARTSHSLAYEAVGHLYAAAGMLVNANRMNTVMSVMDVDDWPMASAYAYANACMDTLNTYLCSDQEEMTAEMVPSIACELSFPIKKVLESAQRIWSIMCDLDDTRLGMTHDGYLKLYQISKPVLSKYDYILFDECQPAGTMVWKPDGSRILIENLKVGDRVMSYALKTEHLNVKYGSVVDGINAKPFSGNLVVVTTVNLSTRYTPNHHCIAKIGPALHGKHILYLMRRGDHFRVGVTSTYHGNRRGAVTGVRGRLTEEGGEALWILGAYQTRAEALLNENLVTFRHRIPQVRFDGGDTFWLRVQEDMVDCGISCLTDFGRDINYPLIVSNNRRMLLFERATVIRACNLMDGMLVLDAEEQRRIGSKGHHPKAWKEISVGRQPYSGLVYSMNVARSHTYVGDGLVTHNCQDSNPVTSALVLSQDCAKVMVGDRHQQIYTFRGARDAMDSFEPDATFYLTTSFRFGAEVARTANALLSYFKGETHRLVGMKASDRLGTVDTARQYTIISRTNSGLFDEAVTAAQAGKKLFFVGGIDGYKFASVADAYHLMTGDVASIRDPYLKSFKTFSQMEEYAEVTDDKEAKMLCKVVGKYGSQIPQQLERIYTADMKDQVGADICLTTAHKSKGLEFAQVRLANDFADLVDREGKLLPADLVDTEEINILYVACTRAELVLEADVLDGLLA